MNQTAVAARLRQFEGSVPYMYRCTGGEVTVGVGHAIQVAGDASKLTWVVGGAAAAPSKVLSDYAAIAAATVGLPAPSYEARTQCRMPSDAIDRLLLADLAAFENHLTANLPRWTAYPEPAQEALFDMAFNLGIGGLLKFHNLLAAVDAGNWEVAAQQCHRMGIGEARNVATAALFRACIQGGPG